MCHQFTANLHLVKFSQILKDIYKRGLIKVYFTEVSNSDPIMGIIVSKSF